MNATNAVHILNEVVTAVEPIWKDIEAGNDGDMDTVNGRRIVTVTTSAGPVDVWLRNTEHGFATDVPFDTGGWSLAWTDPYRGTPQDLDPEQTETGLWFRLWRYQ